MDFTEESEYFEFTSGRRNCCIMCYEHGIRYGEGAFAAAEMRKHKRRELYIHSKSNGNSVESGEQDSECESVLIKMDPDPTAEKLREDDLVTRANLLDEDDHHSPVTPQNYIVWRLDKIVALSQKRIPQNSIQGHFFSTLTLILASVASVVSFFGAGPMIAVVTALATG